MDHKDGSTGNITNHIDEKTFQIEGITKTADGKVAFMYKGNQE